MRVWRMEIGRRETEMERMFIRLILTDHIGVFFSGGFLGF